MAIGSERQASQRSRCSRVGGASAGSVQKEDRNLAEDCHSMVGSGVAKNRSSIRLEFQAIQTEMNRKALQPL